jgi:hypothetical protein
MLITDCRGCCLVLTIAMVFLSQAAGHAQTVDAVRDAYKGVDRMLTGGRRADKWREYLLLDELSDQMQKGLAADRATVTRIHARFVKGCDTTARRELIVARDAIGAWLKALIPRTLEELSKMARESADGMKRPTATELREQRATMRRLIKNLDVQVSRYDTNGKWREFFGIQRALAQLRDGKKVNPLLIEMIAQRHAAVAPILKSANVDESAAAHLKTAKMFRAADASDDEYEEQIGRLADALASYAKQPDAAEAKRIVEALSWLDAGGQAASLVAAARPHFYQPNLFVRASRPLVAAGINSTIDERLEVDEMILGGRHIGTGQARGSVSLEFVPDARHLSMRIKSATTITSNTSTYQNSVSVDSRTTMNVRASKRVLFDPRGSTLLPSLVEVGSNSEIVNVSASGRLFGRRIAERRAYSGQGASEEAARVNTRSRVRTQIDESVAKLIRPVEKFYLRQIRLPLLTRGNAPRNVRTRTTSDFVDVSLTQASPKQWSVSGSPPPLKEPFDLSVRMHESFVGNLSAGLLHGTTVSESRLQAELEKLFGQAPEGLKPEDPDRVWTVTFDEQQPLVAKFDDSTLTFSLRATGFTLGEKAYPGMWITVCYELAPSEKGFVGKRQGRLEILPPGFDLSRGDKLGVRQQVLRSMLRKRFERVFPAQWTADPIHLTGRWQQAGKLSVAQLAAQGGWLTIGFRLPTSKK